MAKGNEGRDKGNAEKATRRKLVKLDENRLLNPSTGFPQLIKMTKGFKLKGKGHEVRLNVTSFKYRISYFPTGD
jgi:replication fork protection complex subunit Csm3/Swi3